MVSGSNGQWVKRSVGQMVSGSKGQWVERSVGRKVSGSKGQWVRRSVGQNIYLSFTLFSLLSFFLSSFSLHGSAQDRRVPNWVFKIGVSADTPDTPLDTPWSVGPKVSTKSKGQ
jgi:hypothetical protein